jgi:hypothetical protein
MWSQRIELICGLLSGAFGLAALGVTLFAPSDLICGATPGSSPRGGCVGVSLAQQTGLASQALPIALFGGMSLGILVFTLWQSRSRSLLALVLLWGCAALLTFLTLRTVSNAGSPGVLFIPAAALALVASIAGTLTVRQRSSAPN